MRAMEPAPWAESEPGVGPESRDFSETGVDSAAGADSVAGTDSAVGTGSVAETDPGTGDASGAIPLVGRPSCLRIEIWRIRHCQRRKASRIRSLARSRRTTFEPDCIDPADTLGSSGPWTVSAELDDESIGRLSTSFCPGFRGRIEVSELDPPAVVGAGSSSQTSAVVTECTVMAMYSGDGDAAVRTPIFVCMARHVVLSVVRQVARYATRGGAGHRTHRARGHDHRAVLDGAGVVQHVPVRLSRHLDEGSRHREGLRTGLCERAVEPAGNLPRDSMTAHMDSLDCRSHFSCCVAANSVAVRTRRSEPPCGSCEPNALRRRTAANSDDTPGHGLA